jgi:hypothetical protein
MVFFMKTTMLLGDTVNYNGQLVTFLGFDAGDARIQFKGTSTSMFVPVRSISRLVK